MLCNPVLMCCRKVEEHRTSLSQMLNMADPNPSVTLRLSLHPVVQAFTRTFNPTPFFSRHWLCCGLD